MPSPRTQRDRCSYKSALLADHTVLELASQLVPICASSNVNPCTQLPRRVARKGVSRELSVGRSPGRLGATILKAPYNAYHQLQCPMCQTKSKQTYLAQNSSVFLEERTSRSMHTTEESDRRASLFRSYVSALSTLQQSERPIVYEIDHTAVASLPNELAETLVACEMGERVDLSRILWRHLRSLHFSIESVVHRLTVQLSSTSTGGADQVVVSVPRVSSSSAVQVANRVEEAMSLLLPQQQKLKSLHRAQANALLHDEVEHRSSLEEDYVAVVAMMEVSASAWKASASKSLEQRRLHEQSAERDRFFALESKTREFLDKDEIVAWNAFMSVVRDCTGAFRLQLLKAAIVATLAKEEKIRCERWASCLVEREPLFLRACCGLEDSARRHLSDDFYSISQRIAREHKEWISMRSSSDLERCRECMAIRIVEDAICSVLDETQKLYHT